MSLKILKVFIFFLLSFYTLITLPKSARAINHFLYDYSFSFHLIVNKIQVWCEEAVDTSYHFFSFTMINPVNVAKIFVERASNLPSSTFSNTSPNGNTITNHECEVADLLYRVLESIANSHSYTFEVETTLDHELSESELVNEGDD
jgi:hypothetical protein